LPRNDDSIYSTLNSVGIVICVVQINGLNGVESLAKKIMSECLKSNRSLVLHTGSELWRSQIETLVYFFAKICAKIIFHLDSEVISEDTRSSEDMKLDGSVISLEFAPLTKGIRISNIPPETSSDDMRFKFSNKKIGGGPITDMMLDKKNGVANVYFEKSSGIF
jgi:hypothetical protein